VLKRGCSATADDLRDHLTAEFVKWWLPDGFEFVEEIPRTSTGKFLKSALRSRFRDRFTEQVLNEGGARDSTITA